MTTKAEQTNKAPKKPGRPPNFTNVTSKVAQIVAEYIDESQRTQQEIAMGIGFKRSNALSMVRQGVSRLPVARALDFCRETRGDPERLFAAMIEEYYPELVEILETIKGRVISKFERDAFGAIRAAKKQVEEERRKELESHAKSRAEMHNARDYRAELDNSPEAIEKLAQFIANKMIKS